MLTLALAVVAIALPDSLNPSLIAGELVVAGGRHPGARAVAFTVAAWAVTFGVGLALALGLGDLIVSLLPKPGAKLKYSLVILAGVVLAVGGVIVWVRRRSLAAHAPESGKEEGSVGSPVVLGAGVAGLELLTAFPYFAAIAMIVGSSVSVPNKAFLILLYCVVYTLPLIAIAVVCLVQGHRAEVLLRPPIEWMFSRWPLLVGPLAACLGVALIVYGVLRLPSL
jgi:cytochrome c biogenesis protein CcdA